MVLQLKKYKEGVLPTILESEISIYKYAFNASYLEHNNLKYLAIRVYDEVEKTILAIMYCWENEINISKINLSQELKTRLGVVKVADPKLFVMQNKVWGSFNTGHVSRGDNDLGVFQIDDIQVKSSFICTYSNRMKIEKNWSFFMEKNQLFALYNVNPFTILKGDIESENQIVFKDFYLDEKVSYSNYSIGTPLVKSNDKYLFIGHYKIFFNKKMVYLGKPFQLVFGEKPMLIKGRRFIFHSMKALFGNKKKFNVRLLSCTYFSGILKKNNRIYISYGVNDVKWNIVSLFEKVLWR